MRRYKRLGLQHMNLGDTIQPTTGSIRKGSAQYATQTINGTCCKEMSPSAVAQGHWLPEPSPSPQRDCLGDGVPQMPEPTGMGTVPRKRGIKMGVLHQGAVGTSAGLQWLGDLPSFQQASAFYFCFLCPLRPCPSKCSYNEFQNAHQMAARGPQGTALALLTQRGVSRKFTSARKDWHRESVGRRAERT